MDLSDEQHRAIASIDAWYYGRRSKQVFSVAGYAGTGKTTLIKHAVTSLGLEAVDYAAFTGKAALVMRSKGLDDARTIHSLLYRPVEVEEFDLIEDAIVRKVKWAKKGGLFGLHTSPLIVLDEVSMVDKNLARDLLAYDRPILVVGDPGQLPPIRGEGAFHVDRPDVKLTRIQRQAEHNSIIDVSMKARHGEDIAFGKHGDQVTKIPRSRLSVDLMLRADQIICGFRRTRDEINWLLRSKLGFDDIIPRGTGEEKIVCLQNNYEVGTFNGAFLTLTDRFDVDDETVSYEVSSEDCAISGRHMFLRACFEQSAVPENHQDRETIKAAWAYALTAHKAQGSEWGNVVVIDDRWRRKVEEDRRRWLYTAITRASKNLVIAG